MAAGRRIALGRSPALVKQAIHGGAAIHPRILSPRATANPARQQEPIPGDRQSPRRLTSSKELWPAALAPYGLESNRELTARHIAPAQHLGQPDHAVLGQRKCRPAAERSGFPTDLLLERSPGANRFDAADQVNILRHDVGYVVEDIRLEVVRLRRRDAERENERAAMHSHGMREAVRKQECVLRREAAAGMVGPMVFRGKQLVSVSAFEMVDGALQLYKDLRKKRRDLIPGFNLIQEIVEYLGSWQGRVLPYDAGADQIYRGFSTRIQQELGDDSRIAAIALARGAARKTIGVRKQLVSV